jgi:hypothetical protein
MLDHIYQIKNKVEVLSQSSRSHALIIEGPAGWGKSHSVDEALAIANLSAVRLASYSTPLHLFRHLKDHPSEISILDDVAGVFTDRASMATLKAAMWPAPGGRIVSWGSRTSKDGIEEFEFTGKLVVICNFFPSTADAKAVKSRSLTHFFSVNSEVAKELLQKAALDSNWFESIDVAKQVADFLCGHLTPNNFDQLSYRTLHIGYDLAQHKPDDWRELLSSMIDITATDPKEVVRELAIQGLKVGDQVDEFKRRTGKQRRTFFLYRKELGLAKNG